MRPIGCFKAYDVRGRLGVDLDAGVAYRIGAAFAQTLGARQVVLGRDVRPSSHGLADSLAGGLMDQGCDVLDLGLSGTEEMYFATAQTGACGGICVTASHNPIDYNGMKLVRAGAAPLADDADLSRIRHLAEAGGFRPVASRGGRRDIADAARAAYVARVCDFVDVAALRPLTILVNAGHGTAGPTFDAIAARLTDLGAPLRFERLFHSPDGRFPKGIPNPLLPENRPATAAAVRAAGADFGVAWDGDFDRCFFFDHTGAFVDGEYVVGLLAAAFLAREPGAAILHDPRIIWNTRAVVAQAGGRAVQVRTGHAFVKQAMRDTGAVYGGEMSAHHYFRDFACCDSGMIPWLLMAERVSRDGPLRDLVAGARAMFPSSGEINFTVSDPAGILARVRDAVTPEAADIDASDGLGVDMGDWRFNLRPSQTEPLLRLNVEARGDAGLVAQGVARIRALIAQAEG